MSETTNGESRDALRNDLPVGNGVPGRPSSGSRPRIAAGIDSSERTWVPIVRSERAHSNNVRRCLDFVWSRVRREIPFVLIFLLAAWLVTINVSTPWQAVHEGNGTWAQTVALNHIKYGLGVTKGQDYPDREYYHSYGPTYLGESGDFNYWLTSPDVHPEFYGHHPPALGLTIAGSFLLFGYHYWAERLVPITFILASLIIFYLLVRRVFDLAVARFASALFATYPIFAYYGRQTAQESEVMLFALLLMYGYARWRESLETRTRERVNAGAGGVGVGAAAGKRVAGREWLVLMGAAVAVGGFYDWPMFYFAAILFVMDWVARRRPSKALALATLLPAVIVFGLVIVQIAWVFNWDLHNLFTVFQERAGGEAETGVPIHVGTLDWLKTVWASNAAMFGSWTQVLLPLGAIFVAMRSSDEGWSGRVFVAVTFGAWGLAHILLFRNGAYIHDYWQFYLLPCFALGTAWTVVTVARNLISHAPQRAVALLIMLLVVFCFNVPTIMHYYATGNHPGTNPIQPLIDLWR